MPANLNALIRYKTIDKCLSNPYRNWTITDLMEECSMALSENRGIDTGVSERTLREDIRVMRSDMLGFNAPIVQKDGNYSYEDSSYSIFDVSIHDSTLLERVLNFILEIRSEVDHPDMEGIIEHIFEALPDREPEEESGLGIPSSHPTIAKNRELDMGDKLMDYSKAIDPQPERLRFKFPKGKLKQKVFWSSILKHI